MLAHPGRRVEAPPAGGQHIHQPQRNAHDRRAAAQQQQQQRSEAAEIPDTAVVYDGRIFARPPHLSPEDVMVKGDELRAIGIDWVLVTEG